MYIAHYYLKLLRTEYSAYNNHSAKESDEFIVKFTVLQFLPTVSWGHCDRKIGLHQTRQSQISIAYTSDDEIMHL